MRTILAVLSCMILLTAFEASATAHDCQCKAAGKEFKQGDVVCLSLPTGQQLARCSMVLNNSSWEKLQDGCPLSMNFVPASRWDRATTAVPLPASLPAGDDPQPARATF